MTDEADAAFSTALTHHEAGRSAQARVLYRDILRGDPDHAESLHLLGLITARDGEPDAGARMIRRAMVLAPGRAPHHNSLAATYRMLGRDTEATAEYRAAAALRPESAEILNNLATTLRALGQHGQAVAEYRRAIACSPACRRNLVQHWQARWPTTVTPRKPRPASAVRSDLRSDFAPALANYGRWLDKPEPLGRRPRRRCAKQCAWRPMTREAG